jgi:hypothetical protein
MKFEPAKKVSDIESQLREQSARMCSAHGCPMEWSINNGSRLCSHHAAADTSQWREITDRLVVKVAMGGFTKEEKTPSYTLSKEERKEIVQRLKSASIPAPSKEWALRLKRREEAGETLTHTQKVMWRSALHLRSDHDL